MSKVLHIQLQLLQALPAQSLKPYALHKRLETHFHDACIGGHVSGVGVSDRRSLEGLSHKQHQVPSAGGMQTTSQQTSSHSQGTGRRQ